MSDSKRYTGKLSKLSKDDKWDMQCDQLKEKLIELVATKQFTWSSKKKTWQNFGQVN